MTAPHVERPKRGMSRPAASKPDAERDSRPRYIDLAELLKAEIAKGVYDVGEKLPTESELCRRFDVSRSTVRQALSELKSDGLVERRQGSGTTLVALEPAVRYVVMADSHAEILRYASDTVLEPIDTVSAVPIVDSRRLQLGDGNGWLRWRGIRRTRREGQALGLSTIYLPSMYGDIIRDAGRQPYQPFFEAVAERYNLVVTSVQMTIGATVLDADEAELLRSRVGTPALVTTRRYSCGDRTIEVAEAIHPADRFNYELTLARELSSRAMAKA